MVNMENIPDKVPVFVSGVSLPGWKERGVLMFPGVSVHVPVKPDVWV